MVITCYNRPRIVSFSGVWVVPVGGAFSSPPSGWGAMQLMGQLGLIRRDGDMATGAGDISEENPWWVCI